MSRDSATLRIGSFAPEFALQTADGKGRSLAEVPGDRLALIFIRGTW